MTDTLGVNGLLPAVRPERVDQSACAMRAEPVQAEGVSAAYSGASTFRV